MTSVLNRLDEREREATPLAFWADGSPADEAQLVMLSRSHLRALIDVAWVLNKVGVTGCGRGLGKCECHRCVALAPLLAEEGEE
jgi:hypothetical protein